MNHTPQMVKTLNLFKTDSVQVIGVYVNGFCVTSCFLKRFKVT